MKAFSVHTGLVAAMDRANVDTDQIIPKQFLKRIERSGFGQYLFFDWRFREDGSPNPDFELNEPRFAGASILLAQRNFGCGSSREHAPWALDDFGFRAIIAPSFADIFYNNCFKNGLLPIRLDESRVEKLFECVATNPGYRLTVDLEETAIHDSHGLHFSFEVDGFRRHCLLGGLDEIAMTLSHADAIGAYEASRGIGAGSPVARTPTA